MEGLGGGRVLLETLRRKSQNVKVKPGFFTISEVRGRLSRSE